ncbi:DUF1297 domain-containing protein [Candidatus Peregrinibacteria bacterium]|nr:DUF1297 domain-containing protein [Candidatus Peregrinibacteria bacterium]
MISPKEVASIVAEYDSDNLTIGVLGGHSALDVCHGAKKHGFRTLAVCQKGREKVYGKHYKTRDAVNRAGETLGCVDEVIIVDRFADIVKPSIQHELRKRNTIFIHNRYFWVYCDFADIENKFEVPIFGSRRMLKLEESDQPKNQYYLLEKAGIRMPKIFQRPADIDRLAIVKVNEAERGYERAFFTVSGPAEYDAKSKELLQKKIIERKTLDKAVIEEFVIGAPVNFNFFYSPFSGEVELMGTDTRRQTNLDGLLRLPAWTQLDIEKNVALKMIETGHSVVTVKESLLEKICDLGERFVRATQKEHPPGIIGPFALQGAVIAEQGKEDIVVFDVSLRIPGSPGTRFTPYTGYMYGEHISFGERIALEIAEGVKQGKLATLVT